LLQFADEHVALENTGAQVTALMANEDKLKRAIGAYESEIDDHKREITLLHRELEGMNLEMHGFMAAVTEASQERQDLTLTLTLTLVLTRTLILTFSNPYR
jgi:hypothetical protein